MRVGEQYLHFRTPHFDCPNPDVNECKRAREAGDRHELRRRRAVSTLSSIVQHTSSTSSLTMLMIVYVSACSLFGITVCF